MIDSSDVTLAFEEVIEHVNDFRVIAFKELETNNYPPVRTAVKANSCMYYIEI